jgi:hypothetical protein
MHYWIWKLFKGRIVILGCEDTENEAYSKGLSNFGGEFEIHESMSRDRIRVRDEIKAKVLGQTKDLDLLLKRARYKVPNEVNEGN